MKGLVLSTIRADAMKDKRKNILERGFCLCFARNRKRNVNALKVKTNRQLLPCCHTLLCRNQKVKKPEKKQAQLRFPQMTTDEKDILKTSVIDRPDDDDDCLLNGQQCAM
jgi:hypothetical protein